MVKRNVNFNPGPAALPLEVLKTVQGELLDYQGTGLSILESSHRAKEYEEINHRPTSQEIETVEQLVQKYGLRDIREHPEDFWKAKGDR